MQRRLTETPDPPYFAVIFTSRLAEPAHGYGEVAQEMERLATGEPGYLGHDSVRSANGMGITVSYWQSESAIRAWKENARHRLAQKLGNRRWYDEYELRVARVERAYSGPRAFEA
jgi:heme-degrading monooxygenase HmoA